jgi:sulfatase modifying factor 1
MWTIRGTSLVVLAGSLLLEGCPDYRAVQCIEDSNCDLRPGGVCATAPTGHRWCSHPDSTCPGGFRYDTNGPYPNTGDGLDGVCVARASDAGVDGPLSGGGPSCFGLRATCGPTGNSDCCESITVPGGAYNRSYDVAGDPNSGDTSFPATVTTFRLDKYEVTVGRFRALVLDGAGTQAGHPGLGSGAHPNIPMSGWMSDWNQYLKDDSASLQGAFVSCDPDLHTWTDSPGANESRPINCVSWYEATAFCAWDGGFLPTETEWNYAAAGGDQQRAYPWSSPAGSVTTDGSYASYDCLGDGVQGCALADLVPAGSKPAGNGRWGHLDLAGNVSEWTLDYFAPFANPCADCANFTKAYGRTHRGGDYLSGADHVRTAGRAYSPPSWRSPYIGIRCARTR